MADTDVAAEMQSLQRQLQAYDRHLSSLEQSIGEIGAAITTLEGLSTATSTDARVPIGAGIRIKAQVDPEAPVQMDIGSGYTTETPAGDALSQLRDRLQKTEAALRTTSAEAEKIGMRMQELQTQMSA